MSGFVISVWNILNLSLRQRLAPDALRGRVASAYRVVAVGSTGVGGLIGGVVASAAGLRAPFFLGAPLLLVAALAAAPTLRRSAA